MVVGDAAETGRIPDDQVRVWKTITKRVCRAADINEALRKANKEQFGNTRGVERTRKHVDVNWNDIVRSLQRDVRWVEDGGT